jgi:predicted transcriptional regulator
MACISADGTLTASARKILEALSEPATPEEIAHTTGLPLFRVRSGLREMAQTGLVEEKEGRYSLTESGKQKL